jgi:hypothetical protein
MNTDNLELVRDLTEKSLLIKAGDGKEYSAVGLTPVRDINREGTIGLTSLASFAGFITKNPQGIGYGKAVVVIDEEFGVQLLSEPKEEDRKRTTYAYAKWPMTQFSFGCYYPMEQFLIAIQTLFVQTTQSKQLFMDMKDMRIDDSVHMEDNGMSMKVAVQHGVSSASIQMEQVPVIQTLKPLRYFTEAEQVESPFLLRLSGTSETGVKAALFEADGGAWKIKAAENIASKLGEYGVTLPVLF